MINVDGSWAYHAKIALIHTASGFLSGHVIKYLGKVLSNQTMSTVNPIAWAAGMALLPHLVFLAHKIFTRVMNIQNREAVRGLSFVIALPSTFYLLNLGLRMTISPAHAILGYGTNAFIQALYNLSKPAAKKEP